MQKVGSRKVFGPGLSLLILLTVVAGCGGPSSSEVASATTGAMPPGDTGTGSSDGTGTGTGSSGGTGSTGGTGPTQTTVLFDQPQLSGIEGHFAVPPATHDAPPKGAFGLVLWQTNRFQPSGLLVPTGWDAGSKTGFTPLDALSAQLGFQNQAGTSTAQIEDDTVGAYINSQDLPASTADQKMMITPQFIFPLGSQPMPFASPQSTLNGSMDLQIPTAVGRNAYVVLGLLFTTVSGVRVSYGIAIFRNSGSHLVVGSGHDAPSNTYMLNSPLGVDQRFVTQAAGSASATVGPWSGWRHFEWSISEAQFVSALEYLTGLFPSHVTSADPAHYVFAEVHVNAEFHTDGQPAELGWSMRGLKLWTTP